jgi:Caspase domain
VLAVVRRSRPDLPDPDLFIFGLPGTFKGYFLHYSEEIEETHDRFTWAILKGHTRNTAGTVMLRSNDPRDVPAISFHYFDEGSDKDGAELVVILDSCHSGSGTREIHPLGKSAVFIDDRATQFHLWLRANKIASSVEKKRVLEATVPPRETQKRVRALQPPNSTQQQFTKRSVLRSRDDISTMNHILLAACAINETAGDVFINGRPNGVFTHYLCSVLNNTTVDLFRSDLQSRVTKVINDDGWDQNPRFEARSLSEPLFSDDTEDPASSPYQPAMPQPRQKPPSSTTVTIGPMPSRPVSLDPNAATDTDTARRCQLLKDLQGRRLEDAYLREDIRSAIQAEASASTTDPAALLNSDSIALLNQIIGAKLKQDAPLVQARKVANRDLARQRLLSSRTAVFVPGFLSSQLSDKVPNGYGLIWVNPLDGLSDRLSHLKLSSLAPDGTEADADPNVQIMPDGPLPLISDLLRGALETAVFGPRYWTNVFAFDWRRTSKTRPTGSWCSCSR